MTKLDLDKGLVPVTQMIKFDFDVAGFNEAMRKTAEAFQNFNHMFERMRLRDIQSKKAMKANSRRLRYTLKAHSR